MWVLKVSLLVLRRSVQDNPIQEMKYLAAYLLLNAAGSTPSGDKVKEVLKSVGVEIEDDKVAALISSLEGKSVEELIAEGVEKMASVPAAGPAAGASAGAAAGSAEAVEEAAESEAEESDDGMGFGLFD